jgi:glycosyltransferase involved in cell wall biosynthesis
MLLPMSQATADSLETVLNAPMNRMVVIPPVINSEFKQQSLDKIDSFLKKYSLPRLFWLYVAHYQPHKNHLRLLSAFHEMKTSGFKPWPLVLRGDNLQENESIQKLIKEYELSTDIYFLPKLTIGEMTSLYSSATALIFPSLYEGGGIPVIEAMACGCPVVSSDLPSILEFAGDVPYYLNPSDQGSIVEAMKKMQINDFLAECKAAGIRQAKIFGGKCIVDNLLKSYEAAIK